jgi:CRP-like cAMP-binding protein
MQRFSYEDGARLLVSEAALPELRWDDALRIVPFMDLTLAREGSVIFRAGGPGRQFLVLVLEGDAVVEGQPAGSQEWIVLRPLGPGNLFGEMGALDSMARAVVVRALSETCLATLEDEALARIVAQDAALGCRLLQAVLAHMTRRLRAANHKVEALNEINQALRAEWQAQSSFDRAAHARLSVLMKLERQLSASGSNDSRPPASKRA